LTAGDGGEDVEDGVDDDADLKAVDGRREACSMGCAKLA
jgi:hypothetical protein